ncbi:pimeloyl-ACP methyl ester carboxylesterase [Kribbella sp. VKM Ac-2569]|uniref:alpha/beta fold hydrolase n=1 Tax=Kribbella sp. VKM Ac-2569 TaxID=2512220 RepID=UPI00102B66BA|nr:alpha/beta hydrolase [Kribbella sp. VKM Ac-2569]RZT20370.1 pimeloyl-ACP methyl ester carboxylesterase [Kribbella sp. VKM Ac-2569]
MEKVTSADGTTIAYDRLGSGHPLILVGGALCDRHALRPLADELANHFDVVTYDRRGRGDSGDNTSYDVLREVDDIAALLTAVGGTAAVYGHSSGAGLAAIAASRLPFTRVVLHEPPYGPDDVDPSDDGEQVLELIRDGQNREAVELFLLMTGMPKPEALQVAAAPGVAELAPTLAYDFAVMGHEGTTPIETLRAIKPPTLVIAGTATAPFMLDAAHRIVSILPNATLKELPDQHHVVPPELLAPVIQAMISIDTLSG